MINQKKIVVVLPAYNAMRTLEKTYREIPMDLVDEVILVDDASQDKTVEVAGQIGIKHIIRHSTNTGYGGNQKTCYNKALELGADIIIMLHPDYQYPPHLIKPMAEMVANNEAAMVLATRIIDHRAIKGGMPIYKYVFNRILTQIQNFLFNKNLSEYHTGYRAFSRSLLTTISYELCSNNFIFDNQIISQAISADFTLAEIQCPTRYSSETSSISMLNSFIYGFGVISTSILHALNTSKIWHSRLYQLKEKKPPR